MSWAQIVMWSVVLGLGLPAAFRNPVAAALVLQWSIAQGSWLATGDELPIWLYRPTDIAVLAIIYLKHGRTRSDWTVVAIFPVMWAFYAMPISKADIWWSLWVLAILQFMSAAVGALEDYRLVCSRAASSGLKPPGWFRVAGWALAKS